MAFKASCLSLGGVAGAGIVCRMKYGRGRVRDLWAGCISALTRGPEWTWLPRPASRDACGLWARAPFQPPAYLAQASLKRCIV